MLAWFAKTRIQVTPHLVTWVKPLFTGRILDDRCIDG